MLFSATEIFFKLFETHLSQSCFLDDKTTKIYAFSLNVFYGVLQVILLTV